MLWTIVWAVIVGAILGYLAKLILPGRQDIPAWATIAAGMVAAFLGGLVAGWLGVGVTAGVDWIKLALQIIFAIAGVAIVARIFENRRARRRY